MAHLVSIISDQAVPNLLFIKQFTQPDSHFYFISSQEMEEKQATRNLKAALKLPEKKCHTIVIDANDALLVFDQLKGHAFPSDEDYLINLTGGNKLMSQMVFQHFLDFDSRMYYAPIGSQDYQVLYPEVERIPKDQSIKTSLDDYLRAYGFVAKSSLVYYEGKPAPDSLMRQVIKTGHPAKVKSILQASQQDYKGFDKGYLMGEWFELYCYKFFREAFSLSDNQIACSVGVKRADSDTPFEHDNEFDLMFIHQNDLYVFECKVYTQGKITTRKISQPMFKLASLTQKFGLKCKKYMAVLGEFSRDTDSVRQLENLRLNLEIAKILDIDTFGQEAGRDILREDVDYKINQLLEKFNSAK